MNFEELKEHCNSEGCDFEPLAKGVYIAKNCINGEVCLIEDLETYDTITLCHYFAELKIGVPYAIEDDYAVYQTFRNSVLIEAEDEDE